MQNYFPEYSSYFGRAVGGASHQERRRGLGENERDSTMNGCGWVGGGKEGETNDPETVEEKVRQKG